MSVFGSDIDIQFYELIHSLQTNQPVRHSDRRRLPRQFAGKRCRVAPYKGEGELPNDGDYMDVICYDLTRQGFAFFADREPNYDRVIAEFRVGKDQTLVDAQVRRCEQVLVLATGSIAYVGSKGTSTREQSPDGDLQYLVGCEFTRRLSPEKE